jgi:hypothetical protein
MTAQTRPAHASPFLAFVGESDRNLLHVALWAALGIPLAGLGLVMLLGLLQAAGPHMASVLKGEAPHIGPHQLVWAGDDLLVKAFSILTLAAALLGSAKLAFQREAWTFVTPSRRFDFGLMGLGLALFVLVFAVQLGIEEALDGKGLTPPLADPTQPWDERAVFALVLVPFLLVVATASAVVFQGVLVQVTAAFSTSRLGICLSTGLIFALTRLDFDPFHAIALLALGATLAWSVLELGGLEFSLGANLGVNLVAFLLVPPSGAGPAFKLADMLHLDVWADFAMTLAICAITVAATAWIKRRLPATPA